MKHHIICSALAVVVLVVGTLAACAPGQQPVAGPTEALHGDEMPKLEAVTLGTGEKLRVVATTSIVGDVVSRVGGDDIELTVLIPLGSDLHTFQPTPQDAAAIAKAHLVVTNGAGLEGGWMSKLLENAGGKRPLVPASAGVTLRQGGHHHHEEEEGADEHEEEEEHEHEGNDPHVWFDVKNVVAWTRNVEQALAALDPAKADEYHQNAANYTAELQELDAWIEAQVKQIPAERRKLVTSHEAFGYFCDRYGLEQVGAVFPVTTEAQPSAKDLAQLQEAIKTEGVQAVFAETTVNPALVEQLARDSGIKVVTLYTGSLGKPGSEADSYVKLMRYDVEAITTALR